MMYLRVTRRRYETMFATYLRVVGPGPIGNLGRRGLLADITQICLKNSRFPRKSRQNLVVGRYIDIHTAGTYLDFVTESRSVVYKHTLFQYQ